MNRLEATQIVLRRIDKEPVIATLGHTSYDLFACGDRPANLYTWGSMGLTTSLALGLAIARPEMRVLALDGEGSLLMNLGSLATIAARAPTNLVVVVWDNEQYATTGGQPTATACGTNIADIAKGAGIRHAVLVRDPVALDDAMKQAWTEPGPWVIVAKVGETVPTVRPPLDPVYLKHRFMAALQRAE